MKRFFAFLFVMFCTVAHATTVNIDWMVDNTTYAQTTCEYGDDLNIPSTPTKYGYVFRGWNKATYLQLEYIQSTGTEYITTTYIPPFRDDTKTVHITTEFENLDTNTSWNVALTNNRDNDYGYVIYVGSSRNFYVLYGYRGQTIDTGLKTGKIKIETISQGRTYTVKANDTTFDTKTCGGEAPSITDNIGLLRNANNSNHQYKLYGFSVAVDGVMMENLVPAQRTSDDKIGLYDTVNKTFFENSGSGDFIAGPIVGGIVE